MHGNKEAPGYQRNENPGGVGYDGRGREESCSWGEVALGFRVAYVVELRLLAAFE